MSVVLQVMSSVSIYERRDYGDTPTAQTQVVLFPGIYDSVRVEVWIDEGKTPVEVRSVTLAELTAWIRAGKPMPFEDPHKHPPPLDPGKGGSGGHVGDEKGELDRDSVNREIPPATGETATPEKLTATTPQAGKFDVETIHPDRGEEWPRE